MVQRLGFHTPRWGTWVQSLVGKLRSRKLGGVAKKILNFFFFKRNKDLTLGLALSRSMKVSSPNPRELTLICQLRHVLASHVGETRVDPDPQGRGSLPLESPLHGSCPSLPRSPSPAAGCT